MIETRAVAQGHLFRQRRGANAGADLCQGLRLHARDIAS